MTASAQAAAAQTTNASARFGTFGGVFTPNVLTILGLILFLRAGWVVGQAGLMGALLIVLIANSISFLTGLSLSAIATSMNVRAGGKYYLISRTLGREIGGAIGVPLYLSQAISVAFYIIGFTESLEGIAFFSRIDARALSTLIAIVFAVVAFIGADFAIKIQYFILAALMAALLSFFAGGWGSIQAPTMIANYGEGMSFWSVFAVFFPAVTGIAVGASMSGDLKDPGRSIHKGTLLSVLFTAVVYFLSVIWLSLHGSPDELKSNTLIMRDIALFPPLILIGVWAATLSSALGSIVAAPRTLQAMANDGIVPRALGLRLGSRTEPRVGVLITAGIAFAVIWAGDLNVVAPIITMFFLNTYGMTNLVAGIEKLVGNPSFRPRANIHFSFSLLGAAGCYGAMFVINPTATVIAILISYGIYFYLERRSTIRTWGDVRNGIWFAVARRSLLNLERSVFHAKNWRPNILVFTGQPHNRAPLVEVANLLSPGVWHRFVLPASGGECRSAGETTAAQHRAAADPRVHPGAEHVGLCRGGHCGKFLRGRGDSVPGARCGRAGAEHGADGLERYGGRAHAFTAAAVDAVRAGQVGVVPASRREARVRQPQGDRCVVARAQRER